MSRLTKISISSVFIFFLIFIFLKYSFWEPSGVERKSLIYKIKIPTQVKEFPVWGEIDKPIYGLNIADGEKPRILKIEYTSKLERKLIVNEIEKVDFICVHFSDSKMIYKKNDQWGQVYEITTEHNGVNTNIIKTFSKLYIVLMYECRLSVHGNFPLSIIFLYFNK